MNPVESYIVENEQQIRSMLQKIHAMICACAPQMEARLTYNIPFYYYLGRIFYLNPKEDGVDLGFCRGALLAEHPLLGRAELKEVRIINYKSLQDIEEETLVPLIFEALMVNEMIKKAEIKRKAN